MISVAVDDADDDEERESGRGGDDADDDGADAPTAAHAGADDTKR